jgi:hypothetical protein
MFKYTAVIVEPREYKALEFVFILSTSPNEFPIHIFTYLLPGFILKIEFITIFE